MAIVAIGFVMSMFVVLVAGALTYRRRASEIRPRLHPVPANSLEVWIYTVVGAWLIQSGLYKRLVPQIPQLVRHCVLIYGHSQPDPAFRWIACTATITAAGLLASLAAYAVGIDPALAVSFGAAGIIAPMVRRRELQIRVKRRHEAFVTELPNFMHKLSLLLAAGETVQRAWVQAGSTDERMSGHPLYAELFKTGNEIVQSVPFAKALERLHLRCGVNEMSSLVTTVLMNYRRGGDAFAFALQDASRQLMERKHAIVRTKGEEASAKLIFPMMLMLLAVMLMVAAPAVMLMNQS